MTFFGHTDICTEVTALCRVEGGPSYQLVLAGEASDIQYRLDRKKIYLNTVVREREREVTDSSIQVYDTLCCEEVTLTNIGKVSLDFTVLGVTGDDQLLPDQVSVSPSQVHLILYWSLTLSLFLS